MNEDKIDNENISSPSDVTYKNETVQKGDANGSTEITEQQKSPHIDVKMSPESHAKRSKVSATEDLLEELADDMLEVIRRLKLIEAGQQTLLARIDHIEESFKKTNLSCGRQLEVVRGELSGQQKTLAARSAFMTVVSTLESLRVFHKGLHAKRDIRLINQVTAIELSLVTTLQMLGFEEFRPKVGDHFDPSSMQCISQEKGTPGKVLRVLHPGWHGAGVVMRYAGVVIAEPGNSSTR